MKKVTLSIALVLALNFGTYAQSTANEWMQQAQTELAQKEYIKARYGFKRAFDSFSQQKNYNKAVQCGIQVSTLYTRENYYKEGFELCAKMNQLVLQGEQESQKPLNDLRFLVTKERLRIFTQLKNPAKAKEQLTAMESIQRLTSTDSIKNILFQSKASYYFTFGPAEQGLACYREILDTYKKERKWDKASEVYQDMIALAVKVNNAFLTRQTYQKYAAFTDSVKAITASDELSALKLKFDDSQQKLQETESQLDVKQYFIWGLCAVALVLVAGLLFLFFTLLYFIRVTKRQKKNIAIANEHNKLQAEFMQNIAAQMEPSFDALSSGIESLPKAASQSMEVQLDALKAFGKDVQELISLENSINELYEVNEFYVNSFCEKLVEEIRPEVRPEVKVVINAPQLQVKTNSEQLKRVLTHLLKNAAAYTESGMIILDFKKRGAHTMQFLVTDTGVGIPAERQADLFKPFTEIRDLAQGNGLGLPICSLIAGKMNGSLTIDGSYTKGSRFVLELHS